MNILFLDIETAPEFKHYEDMPEAGQVAFRRKVERTDELIKLMKEPLLKMTFEQAVSAIYADKVALYAEFTRIVCIGIGVIKIGEDKTETLYLKGLVGTEEEILLGLIAAIEKNKPYTLCAHNGKGFDYPFIIRRMIMKNIPVPSILNVVGKKPWEVILEDTIEMWRFTDMKYYVSLVSLCYCLGIPSPKEDMDGTMVPAAFFDGKIDEIKKYCLNDVLALVQCRRKLGGLPLILEEKVIRV